MALITCKNCGHTVSDKAEKCPKCGYPVRLSMKQDKEAEQPAEIHSTTGTEKQEVVNNEPQPKGSKKGLIMAVVAVVIIGCGVLFALLGERNAESKGETLDIPSIETRLRNVGTIQDARLLIEGTVWEHTVNTDESELGYWLKVEFANGRYKSFYMLPSDDGWTYGGEGSYEITEGKFSNTGERYIAVHWEGKGYSGWPMKYALVLNNFQVTAVSSVPDPDRLSNPYKPIDTYSGFMELVDVIEVEPNEAVREELPSDSMNVEEQGTHEELLSEVPAAETEYNDVVARDSCKVEEVWES